MYTYHIKKPWPVPVAPVVQQPAPFVPRVGHSRGAMYGTTKCPWSKIDYIRWVETVKEEFQRGDMCIIKGSHLESHGGKPFYYTIEAIQEIHYIVEFDEHFQEPMALSVVTPYGFRMNKAPSSVRKLTKAEVDHVNVYNTRHIQNAC